MGSAQLAQSMSQVPEDLQKLCIKITNTAIVSVDRSVIGHLQCFPEAGTHCLAVILPGPEPELPFPIPPQSTQELSSHTPKHCLFAHTDLSMQA